MKKVLLSCSLGLALLLASLAPAEAQIPNRNVAYNFSTPPAEYQGEVRVAVNPNNANQIVAASNTTDSRGGTCGFYGLQAVFYSSNGGQTWGYSCPPDESSFGLGCTGLRTFGSDPALAWNRNNELFLNYTLSCLASPNLNAIVVARSVDGGATWSAQGVISFPGGVQDRSFYAIDNHPGSPFFGRHYTCWARADDEKLAFSSDNGVSWTEIDLPPTGGGESVCDIAVQKNGTIHVIWNSLPCPFGTPCSTEETYHTRSADGGASWSNPQLVVATNLADPRIFLHPQNRPLAQNFRGINSFGAIDVDNSGGWCDGTLYVAYTDFPAGGNVNNSDIFIRRSTNGGNTWSAGVRVNDDGAGGRVQFHPFLVMDQLFGTPVVAWHDARNDPANTAVDFYTARSSTCGQSFEPNIKASQPSTEFANNSTISSSNMNLAANSNRNFNQYGDFLGLDVRLGKAYMAWTDTRHYFPFHPGPLPLNSPRENIGFTVVNLGPDSIPPAPPMGLTATVIGSGRVRLDWNDNTEADLAGYNVYRSTTRSGPYTLIGTTMVSNMTSVGLMSGTTYYFVVTAIDISGNQSLRSGEVSATP